MGAVGGLWFVAVSSGLMWENIRLFPANPSVVAAADVTPDDLSARLCSVECMLLWPSGAQDRELGVSSVEEIER